MKDIYEILWNYPKAEIEKYLEDIQLVKTKYRGRCDVSNYKIVAKEMKKDFDKMTKK